jgi:5-methylcytosine-specific restriction endonuclease McrA
MFDNGIELEIADEDGFHLKEKNGNSKVYIYFSELKEIIQMLKKLDFVWNSKINLEQSTPHSKVKSQNANFINKSFDTERQYANYILKSDEWQKKRNQVIKRDKNRCRNCGTTIDLQVHHKNYDRFGNESLDDLVTLCYTCHEKITRLNKKKRR